MRRIVQLGLVQHACGTIPADNLQTAAKMVNRAAELGAQVVVTQELFTSRYFCQNEDHTCFDLAEPIPGPATEALSALAKQREIVIVASLFERRAPGLFHNTAVVIDANGSLLGRYRKAHIPDDPLYYEKFYFTPGDTPFRAFDTRYGRIGVLVCWDQWFPEAARLTALAGAELIVCPTAVGWHPGEKEEFGEAQHDAWETVQRGHAIANGVFVAAANRVGFEPGPSGATFSLQGSDPRTCKGHSHLATADGIEFWGGSFAARPDGRVLARASYSSDEVLLAELDLSLVDVTRKHWPFLRDRRVDLYDGMTRLYGDEPV